MNRFWRRLSRRERSLVVVTGVIVLVFIAKYAVITPLLERRAWVREQLESQPQLLAKNLRYVAQKEAMLAALESAREQIKAQEPKLLTGDTPSVNASDLQETVQAMAAREGTQVITTRVLTPETVGSFSKIGIQLEIGGQIQQLASLIRGIETAPKLLTIDEVNVRSLFRPIGFPQTPGVPQPPAQNLRVSLMVSGYARPLAAAPTKTDSPAAENSASVSSAASCFLSLYRSGGSSVGTGPMPSLGKANLRFSSRRMRLCSVLSRCSSLRWGRKARHAARP